MSAFDRFAARYATMHDDDSLAGILSEKHEDHLLAPEFKAVGMKQSPCTASWCEAHDQEHEDAYEKAYDLHGEGKSHTHDLDLSRPIHGMETRADMNHIHNLAQSPEKAKGRALVMEHKGQIHVLDGHHRIAAGMLRGDTHHPVHLVEIGGK